MYFVGGSRKLTTNLAAGIEIELCDKTRIFVGPPDLDPIDFA